MAKPTVAELEKTIAELAAEINELRNGPPDVELQARVKTAEEDAAKAYQAALAQGELRAKAERGQDAMFKEAKRLSQELTELRTKYVQVPRDMWDMIDQLPNLVWRARQAHPILCSVNEVVMLANLKDRWQEVVK